MESGLPAASAPSLEVRGLTRSYGAARVLDDVTLIQLGAGCVGLTGPNGSGKTTLLRCIAQLVEPQQGTVAVCGRLVHRADDSAARRLVGWVAHEALAWRDQSVVDNLIHAARLGGLTRRAAAARAAELVTQWGLDAVATTPVQQCSRGWKQRYALARADLLTPPVLLLDEPTTGLDGEARSVLEAAIERWRRERVVVIASHEHAWLAVRCNQLIDLGRPEQVRA